MDGIGNSGDAEYTGCETDYTGQGIDQLQKVIDDLKNPETRNSRRHIVSAWNPEQLDAGMYYHLVMFYFKLMWLQMVIS